MSWVLSTACIAAATGAIFLIEAHLQRREEKRRRNRIENRTEKLCRLTGRPAGEVIEDALRVYEQIQEARGRLVIVVKDEAASKAADATAERLRYMASLN
ncbi:hypothetical protein HYV30_00740 [Candidatus Kaiserbacteria bacterium]|nr:hypothetical protein [Candidatus Kaiserbacteria bacterium]